MDGQNDQFGQLFEELLHKLATRRKALDKCEGNEEVRSHPHVR
jgi:hypothetical protein